MHLITALFCGLVFSTGLVVSELAQPTKVKDFFDVFGNWDPSMGFLMVVSMLISVPGFMLIKRRERPVFATKSFYPTKTEIDQPLVIGSVLFGLGWGLVGLCPAPMLVGLSTLSPHIIVFVASAAAGILFHDNWQAWRQRKQRDEGLATAAKR